MKQFTMKRFSKLPQEYIFQISTDVENFHNIMPNYFKSLNVLDETKYGKLVDEKISFLGTTIKIKTKHVIIYPNIHEIHILTGPLKGTSFVEYYDKTEDGTMVTIDVSLKFNNFFRLFSFMQNILAKKMSKTMDEFILSVEKYALVNSHG
ncbi:hypothetical protein Nisw_08575 [Candidatus Nitrosopumilus sp. SW]|uniref:SRPBCC family protein n=1 Tax=Candidatus Nitrosopumilus sp. SW TaxID=2508726 RepID=UPI00114E83B3|nr:SRPBCC family protein [Candidatus Nitrosopumilus sp. SW]QDI89568.1 hypothetical protein Nisw_08575 [Candidatus Nitrosopumilus sp. SW]